MTVIPVDNTAFVKGFDFGMTILSECDKHKDFDFWFTRIQNVVVRYLVEGTGELKKLRDDCFFENISKDKQLNPTLDGLLRTRYQSLFGEYKKGDNPNFLYPQIKQTRDDYLNLDIPVFYHRIGTCEMVDSTGNQVTLPREIDLPRNTFFVNAPTKHNIEQKQVHILREKDMKYRRRALTQSILTTIPGRNAHDDVNIEKLFRPIKD
jgi:hypothetical protein